MLDLQKQRIFLIDERHILKCFDVQSLLKKLENSTKKGFLQHIPQFKETDFKWTFSVKAHRENLISLELIVIFLKTAAYIRARKTW